MTVHLFSFRRCPYAIRARLALSICRIPFQIIEVDLKNKPPELFQHSSKGTVPVLVNENQVIDESYDIVLFAFKQNQHDFWIHNIHTPKHHELYDDLHSVFIPALNHYKYPDRYENIDSNKELFIIEEYLSSLNDTLSQSDFMFGSKPEIIDLSIFPFIRQLNHIQEDLIEKNKHLHQWLCYWLHHESFISIMRKIHI